MKSPIRSVLSSLVVVVLIILGGVGQTATAQWKKVTNLPSPYNTGYYLDVFFLPTNPQYGWVCGFRGYVLRTTDGGQTWQGVSLASAGNSSSSPMLESIHFASPLIGYTSGPDGVFKTTNGGSLWKNVTPPNPRGHQFWGCFFITPDIGLVVAGGCSGDGQAFFRTTDGGTTWTSFAANVSASGMSDAMLYSSNGLGYASSSGWIWKTLDGGNSWNPFSQTGTLDWQEEIANLGNSFLVPTAGNDCSGQGSNEGTLRFSTDNGATWNRFSTGEAMFGTCLLNSKTGWGVGSNRSVFYTNDGGLTWQNRNCGIEGNDDLDDVYFITDSIGWTVGDGLYYTHSPQPLSLKITPSGPLRFCEGDSVTLTPTDGYSNYVWSNGSKERIITVGKSGKYILSVFNKELCSNAADSIEVIVNPRPTAQITTSNSRPVICFGDTLILTATPGYPSYKWSNGETTQQIRVTKGGDYTVAISDTNGCVGVADTIRVKAIPFIKPIITAKHNFSFCIGDSLVLNAPAGYMSYKWSNGETTQKFITKIGGTFTVTVVDSNGCVGISDTVTVFAWDAKNKLEILSLLDGDTFVFDSTNLGVSNCKGVLLRNRDDKLPFVLDEPYLVKNVYFSVPQNQLPIIIPPLGTLTLNVCFSPVDTSEKLDTLILQDTCSEQILPLRSVGKGLIVESDTRCQVPLTGIIYSLGANYQLCSPYPQPANTTSTIVMSVVENSPKMTSHYQPAILKDLLGNAVSTAEMVILSEVIDGMTTETKIEYIFDIRTLAMGVYYVHFILGGEVKVAQIMIQR